MDNLEITEFNKSDLHLVSEWRSNPAVNMFIRPGIRTPEEVRKWYDEYFSEEANRLYQISYKGSPIGYFTIEGIDNLNRQCEFGIVIGEPELYNKGFGSLAIGTMLRKAFEEMNMHRVFAGIEEENIPSIRCFMKSGFTLEGRLREAKFTGGKYKDILLFSVLENEWRRENALP
jgi:RimJ/RimL family protein N-acetyltransferase